jgi:hypothetical protein
MSEQKILTRLLYDRQYNGFIDVTVLSKQQFPSGYAFFNKHIHYRNLHKQSSPVIIHNNFMIGKEMKRRRFARYGLWTYSSPVANKYNHSIINSSSTSYPFCNYDPMVVWTDIAAVAHRDSSIPAVTIVLPIHTTIVEQGQENRFLVQILMEGFESGLNSKGKMYISNTPPSFIEFDTMAMLELQFTGISPFMSATVIIGESNLQFSVDVTLGKTIFAMDRLRRFVDAADRTADAYRAIETPVEDITNICDEISNVRIPIALCDSFNTHEITEEKEHRLKTLNVKRYKDQNSLEGLERVTQEM